LSTHTNDTNNPHGTTINKLDDVVLNSPIDEDFLMYDGNNWINKQIESGVYSITESTNNSIPVYDGTSGTFIKDTTITIDNGDLNMNGGEISTDSIKFNTAYARTGLETTGTIFWDDQYKTWSCKSHIAGVTGQLFFENWIDYVNKTGSTIANGAVLYISGAQGQKLKLAKAIASYQSQAHGVIAMATHDCANNADGIATTSGVVRDVDTSAWVDGTVLYLSTSVSGGLTSTIPTKNGTNHIVEIGRVIYQHGVHGEIQVNIKQTSDLHELDDVTVTSATDGDVLQYDATAGVWKNSSAITDLEDTGRVSWSGSGAYYSIVGSGASAYMTVLRGGTGRINGKLVTWAANQSTTAFADNTANFVYIDSTGTIQTTTNSHTAFANITLFEVLDDGTNHVVVKEDHPYAFDKGASRYLHRVVGTVLAPSEGSSTIGANITRVATGTGAAAGDRQIKIVGSATLFDHGLTTDIPDSAGAAVTFNFYYTNASGKWIRQSQSTSMPMVYNNAGTITALSTGATNDVGIINLYVSKDDLNASSPTYFGVIHNAVFNTTGAAQSVINAGTYQLATNELAELELCQIGVVILQNNGTGGYIFSAQIFKTTFRSGVSTGTGTNDASLVNTNITNFNNILSAADTTVQSALDAIDNLGATPTEIGYLSGVTSSIQTQIGTKAPIASPTFTGTATAPTFNGSGLTISQLLGTDASKNIVSLPVATYPSLTELTYVKGVTSAIQTQFSNKQPLNTNLTSLSGLTYVSSSFVKMTGANTFTLDTTSYQPLLTNPVTGTGVSRQISFWNGTNTQTGDTGLVFETRKTLTLNDGFNSVAIGTSALLGGNGGIGGNVSIGTNSGYTNTSDFCVFIGNYAGYFGSATGGRTAAIAIGPGSMQNASTSSNDIGIGQNSLYGLQTLSGGNIGIGQSSFESLTTGSYNTALGVASGSNMTTGNYNVCIGPYIGSSVSHTGSNNLYLGRGNVTTASESNTIRIKNATSAYTSMYIQDFFIKDALDNVGIGTSALLNNTKAQKNVSIGTGALQTLSFTNSGTAYDMGDVAIGYQAGFSRQPSMTLGLNGNVNVGYQAGYYVTGSNNCVFVGYKAGLNASGNANNSIFIGYLSGGNNPNVGSSGGNVGIGSNSLQNIAAFGSNNVALGISAGASVTSGGNNTFLGIETGNNMTSGNRNIAIGSSTGSSVTHTGSDNLYIGEGNVTTASESNTIRIKNANSAYTATYIEGIYSATNSNAANVVISSTGKLERSNITNNSFTSGIGTSGITATTNYALFPAAQDTITLPIGTYLVRLNAGVTVATSTVSSVLNINMRGAGTAVGTMSWFGTGSITLGGAGNLFRVAATTISSNIAVTAASAVAGRAYNVSGYGILKITTAGTIIPSYQFGATLTSGVVTLFAENNMSITQISDSGTTVTTGGWS
jgi:hypothetical protein